jgi:hypothetical protein
MNACRLANAILRFSFWAENDKDSSLEMLFQAELAMLERAGLSKGSAGFYNHRRTDRMDAFYKKAT